MSIAARYALDLYRSGQLGTAPPPAPGEHDRRVVRELREAAARSGPLPPHRAGRRGRFTAFLRLRGGPAARAGARRHG